MYSKQLRLKRRGWRNTRYKQKYNRRNGRVNNRKFFSNRRRNDYRSYKKIWTYAETIYKKIRFNKFLRWRIKFANRRFFLLKNHLLLSLDTKRRGIWRKKPNYFWKLKESNLSYTPLKLNLKPVINVNYLLLNMSFFNLISFYYTSLFLKNQISGAPLFKKKITPEPGVYLGYRSLKSVPLNYSISTDPVIRFQYNCITLRAYSRLKLPLFQSTKLRRILDLSVLTTWRLGFQPMDKSKTEKKNSIRINKKNLWGQTASAKKKIINYKLKYRSKGVSIKLSLLKPLRKKLLLQNKLLIHFRRSQIFFLLLLKMYSLISKKAKIIKLRTQYWINKRVKRVRRKFIRRIVRRKNLKFKKKNSKYLRNYKLRRPAFCKFKGITKVKYWSRYRLLKRIHRFNKSTLFKLRSYTKSSNLSSVAPTYLYKLPIHQIQPLTYVAYTGYYQTALLHKLINLNLNKNYFNPTYKPYSSSYLVSISKRFFEYYLNSKVALFLNFELFHRLTPAELITLTTVKLRLKSFKYQFSTIFFLNEFVDMIYLAFKLKNFLHLINYLNKILHTLIIWDHKKFFTFFFNIISEQMYPLFNYFSLTGFRILIKGKVGVGGNSRKRKMMLKLGKVTTTNTNVNTYSMNTWLNTKTGALGIKITVLYLNK